MSMNAASRVDGARGIATRKSLLGERLQRPIPSWRPAVAPRRSGQRRVGAHPVAQASRGPQPPRRTGPLNAIFNDADRQTSVSKDMKEEVGSGLGQGESNDLSRRIADGEFTSLSTTKVRILKPVRKFLANVPGPGRVVALWLAQLSWGFMREMPEATGDIREIIGQPVFLPLFNLYRAYGDVFRLSFGPKSFVIVSSPAVVKEILLTNAKLYSKGILAEILAFVMGQGLIPADGEVWRVRRRAILPSLHKGYINAMVGMFGACGMNGVSKLDQACAKGESVEMENFFSRFALDIIGKAVFNYDFNSLTHDDPLIKAVYTVLREAEHRSIAAIPYWDIPGISYVLPNQRRVVEALQLINNSLDDLIAKCKVMVTEEDEEFVEEYLNKRDPSILHFLIASGEEVSSKQLRDDLMTLLIAGHETTAAVLTWTFYLLAKHPDIAARLRNEVDQVCGDRVPTIADIRELRFTTRVINESMRLYPQPPVLLRRNLEDVELAGYSVPAGSDIFIATWNLHRSPSLWERPNEFDPDRFGPLDAPGPNEFTENYKYLPFGGGQRKCIGDQFALYESLCAMAVIMRRFEFTLDPNGPEVGMTTGATIHTTNGVLMKLRKRNMPPSLGREGNAHAVSANHAVDRIHADALAASASTSGHAAGEAAAEGGKCPFGFGAAASSDSAPPAAAA